MTGRRRKIDERLAVDEIGVLAQPLPPDFPESAEIRSGTGKEVGQVIEAGGVEPNGLLGVESDGKLGSERVERIIRWKEKPERLLHAEAMAELEKRYVPNRITLEEAVRRIPKEILMSGVSLDERMLRRLGHEQLVVNASDPDMALRLPDPSRDQDDFLREETVEAFIDDCEAEGRMFSKVPAFVNDGHGFSYDIAATCPRTMGRADFLALFELDESEVTDKTPLELTLVAIELSRKTLKDRSGHRAPYFIEQGAIHVSDMRGHKGKLPNGKVFLAPSLGLLKNASKDEVREYIDLMLTLLIPEKGESLISDTYKLKGFIEEDFISVDLTILANEFGLSEEYEEIFADLLYCQQVQNRSHLAPLALQIYESIVTDNLRYHNEKWGELGEAPQVDLSLASFGHGKGILEKYLAKEHFAKVKGVDVHAGEPKRTTIGNCEFAIVDARKGGNSAIRDALAEIPPSDMVMALDSLHESANPAEVTNGLTDKVNPNGRLFIIDPVYLKSTDPLTPITTFVYDNTAFPESMRPLPDFLDLIGYATLKGFKVEMVKILPGTYFGYGDTFWRIAIILKKSAAVPKYRIPEGVLERTGFVEKPEDIFTHWPLNRIKEEDQSKLLAELGEEMRGKPYLGLWGEIVKALYPEKRELRDQGLNLLPEGFAGGIDFVKKFGEDALKIIEEASDEKMGRRLEKDIQANVPYPYLDEFFEQYNFVDQALKETNDLAGSVRLLKKVLKSIGVELDLSKDPGWKK